MWLYPHPLRIMSSNLTVDWEEIIPLVKLIRNCDNPNCYTGFALNEFPLYQTQIYFHEHNPTHPVHIAVFFDQSYCNPKDEVKRYLVHTVCEYFEPIEHASISFVDPYHAIVLKLPNILHDQKLGKHIAKWFLTHSDKKFREFGMNLARTPTTD